MSPAAEEEEATLEEGGAHEDDEAAAEEPDVDDEDDEQEDTAVEESAEDGGEAEPEEEADEAEPDEGEEEEKDADARAWQTFSDHDACGPHAFAEPGVLAQAVRAAGPVQTRKPEEFDGVMLSAFCVTAKPKPADPNKALARLARHLRDHGANTVVVTAFVDESAPKSQELAQDGDEDADGAGEDGAGDPRIVRLRIELPHWTPADDPTADHSVSLDLFELGDPVEIEVPGRDRAARRTSRSCADLSLF